ncbi:hypothetical protein EJ04DRAFT_449442, partial [Polyplosphaeria fusca]
NAREVRAVELAFNHWASSWAHSTLILYMDNTTAQAGFTDGTVAGEAMDPLRATLLAAAAYDVKLMARRLFCRFTGQTAWPATTRTLGHWVSGRAFGSSIECQAQIQSKTIESYLSALRSVCVDRGWDLEPFVLEHLKRLLTGAHRLFPPREKRKWLPISREILDKILSPKASQSEHRVDRLNLNTAFTAAFSGFLRMGEITYKTADLLYQRQFTTEKVIQHNVTFADGDAYFLLHLPRSKTDRKHEGVDILCAAAEGSQSCPASHMSALLMEDPAPSSAPLFRLHNGPFTWEKQHLSHSEIQALGRWTFDAVNAYYTRDPHRLFELQNRFVTGRALNLGISTSPTNIN